MTSTWAEMFLRHWRCNDSPALVCDDHIVSGNELLQLAASAARTLDELAIAQGTATALLMDEGVEALAFTIGGALTGRPLAPLGTRLPLVDLVTIIGNLDTNILLACPNHAQKAAEVARQTGIRPEVINELNLTWGTTFNDSPAGPEDKMLVIHTSGTSGLPKPVYMDQRSFAARTRAYQAMTGVGPGDRFTSTSPYYHVAGAGMSLTALGMGAALIPMRRFSIEEWQRVGRLGVSYGQLVPTMIERLLDANVLGDAHPRVQQYGAAPIHPQTLRLAMEQLPDTQFIQFYGQTEASPLTCLTHEDHLRALAGESGMLSSVGRPVPGCEIAVENPDQNGIGEVIVRGELSFLADSDGWHRTGDFGRIDCEGYLYLAGRRHDRIIRGGENIYPSEVEAVLAQHPAVKEVAVVGLPDRHWGEIVSAYIVPVDPDAQPSREELRSFAVGKLAKFKFPSEVRYIETLPRNPTGKLLRRKLARSD